MKHSSNAIRLFSNVFDFGICECIICMMLSVILVFSLPVRCYAESRIISDIVPLEGYAKGLYDGSLSYNDSATSDGDDLSRESERNSDRFDNDISEFGTSEYIAGYTTSANPSDGSCDSDIDCDYIPEVEEDVNYGISLLDSGGFSGGQQIVSGFSGTINGYSAGLVAALSSLYFGRNNIPTITGVTNDELAVIVQALGIAQISRNVDATYGVLIEIYDRLFNILCSIDQLHSDFTYANRLFDSIQNGVSFISEQVITMRNYEETYLPYLEKLYLTNFSSQIFRNTTTANEYLSAIKDSLANTNSGTDSGSSFFDMIKSISDAICSVSDGGLFKVELGGISPNFSLNIDEVSLGSVDRNYLSRLVSGQQYIRDLLDDIDYLLSEFLYDFDSFIADFNDVFRDSEGDFIPIQILGQMKATDLSLLRSLSSIQDILLRSINPFNIDLVVYEDDYNFYVVPVVSSKNRVDYSINKYICSSVAPNGGPGSYIDTNSYTFIFDKHDLEYYHDVYYIEATITANGGERYILSSQAFGYYELLNLCQSNDTTSFDFDLDMTPLTSRLDSIITLLTLGGIKDVVDDFIGDFDLDNSALIASQIESSLQNAFPFCIPAILKQVLGLMEVSPHAPVYDLDFFGSTLTIDFNAYGLIQVSEVTSWLSRILFTIGLLLVSRRFIFTINKGGSDA